MDQSVCDWFKYMSFRSLSYEERASKASHFPRKKSFRRFRTVSRRTCFITNTDKKELETTLIIFPHFLLDFQDFLEALDTAEGLIAMQELDGIFQLASFHPDYQFAGTSIDDVENFTNRSPFPMWHILRENSVAAAIENYGNTEEIPKNNIKKLKKLGVDKIKNFATEYLF